MQHVGQDDYTPELRLTLVYLRLVHGTIGLAIHRGYQPYYPPKRGTYGAIRYA